MFYFNNAGSLNSFCLFLTTTELKIPIRISATGLTDMDDNTKPTKSDLAGGEKGPCCACQKTAEEKDQEKDDRVFRKIFENYLHNAIFLPRYSKPRDISHLLFVAPALCLLFTLARKAVKELPQLVLP